MRPLHFLLLASAAITTFLIWDRAGSSETGAVGDTSAPAQAAKSPGDGPPGRATPLGSQISSLRSVPGNGFRQTSDGRFVKRRPDGSFIRTTSARRVTGTGALSPGEFYEKHPETMKALQSVLGTGSKGDAAFRECIRGWQARTKVDAFDFTWTMSLLLTSDGKIGRVSDARVLEEHWPPGFDAEARRCYLSAANAARFPTNGAFSYRVEYSLCVRGARPPTRKPSSKTE